MATRKKRTFNHPEYKLLKKLGEGGMATVYLATQIKLGRHVALKLMSSRISQNDSFKKRFIREARTLAQFRHPNIITIYEVESIQDRWFIVMEYLDGADLKHLMMQGLTKHRSLEIARDVCLALAYAHERNYVHRDIKPENILFDKSGRLVLTDFGIARSMDDGGTQLTQMGVSVGTPAYMAPEQFESSNVDHRADLYSLGVMLFQMLSGERPFSADSAAAMLFKHATAEIPALPAASADVQPLINQLLAKQVSKRPESAAAVIEQIDRLLDKTTTNSKTGSTLVRADARDPAPHKDSTILIADADKQRLDEIDAAEQQTNVRAQSKADLSTAASATSTAPKDYRPLYLVIAVTAMLTLSAAVYFGLKSRAGGELLVDKPEAAAIPEKNIPEPSQPSMYDAVTDTGPQEFFVGRNAAREIVVEVDTTQSPETVFSSLETYDHRQDVSIKDRISAWQFYSDSFSNLVKGEEILELALSRADGWREVEIYDDLIQAGEADAMNYYYRGYGYQMAGRYQEAIEDYDRCLAMDPANEFVEMFRQRAEELELAHSGASGNQR